MSERFWTRRDFVVALALTLPFVHRGQPAPGRVSTGPRPHPTPRPGIDASRVARPENLADFPRARVAFDEVRQIPEIVDGIRCQCGCAESKGNYSLLSCYEGEDAMARWCPVCQSEGRLAFKLHNQGKSLDDIRAAIEKEFG